MNDRPDASRLGLDLAAIAFACVGFSVVRRSRSAAVDAAFSFLLVALFVRLAAGLTSEAGEASLLAPACVFAAEAAALAAALRALHKHWPRAAAPAQRPAGLEGAGQPPPELVECVVDGIDGILWSADPDTGRFVFVSAQAREMLGYPASRWIEEPEFWEGRIFAEDRAKAVEVRRRKLQRKRGHQLEYRMVKADGGVVWLRDIAKVSQTPDGGWRCCGVIVDIGLSKQTEQLLRTRGMYDELTGLPSRAAFLDTLRSLPRSHEVRSVMSIDIDRFQLVNNSLGHPVGDEVLAEVGSRIASVVNQSGCVARLAGDEFGVLSTEPRDEAEARALADRIRQEVQRPMGVGRYRITTTVSIGIAMSRFDVESPEEALRQADIAMYQTKASKGWDSVGVFDQQMREKVIARVRLEKDLRRALENDELEVHFQPIVELESNRVIAFEALVRWRRPGEGVWDAGKFLPQAEEIGLSAEVGWQAVRAAFRQSAAWAETLDSAPDITINLSERELAQPDFVEQMDKVIAETHVKPRNIVIEITEDVIDVEGVTSSELEALKERGFRLALDDFGVGRSSLSRLVKMPIDIIKLDRAFVPHHDRGDEEALIRAVLSIGQDLGMKVIAEGVETREQCHWLRGLGCEAGQGYLFSKAVPAREAEELYMSNFSNDLRALCGRVGPSCEGCEKNRISCESEGRLPV